MSWPLGPRSREDESRLTTSIVGNDVSEEGAVVYQRNVAGYYRVSVARDDMKAPEIYEQEIARYCRYRELRLGELFSDIDYSGYNKSENRPALKELVRRRNEFSAVIVPKLSRFGRSLKHLTQLFDTFDRDGISLVFLDLGMDTSTSQGRLLRNIMGAFAEYESDVRADYARANYRFAMQEGRVWGQPPYGYRAENKRYYIVEDEAEIVRRMYRRYVEGATLYQIAIELHAAAVTGRRNGLWRTTHIGRLLDNPVYAGLTVLDEQRFEAQWNPIVERALWEQVQRLRLPENRGHRKRKEGTGGPYLLTGLIVCGSCGSNAHHHRKTRGSVYQCMTQQHSKKCHGGGVSRDRADRIVTDAVLRRVRFTFGGTAEFVSAEDAWEKATLEDRRRVLRMVLDRVVIEPKSPGDVVTTPRSLRLEWKAQFRDALVAAPLPEREGSRSRKVREGRAESHREARQKRAKMQRSQRSKTYFDEWQRFLQDRIIGVSASKAG